MTNIVRAVTGCAAVAVATGVAWYAWLGHDRTWNLDPATGAQTGPWTTAQVAGCLLTLVVVLVAAVLLRVPPVPAAGAMTVTFVAAWTATAAATDDSGLFMVGAVLVLLGMSAGTAFVAGTAAWLLHRR